MRELQILVRLSLPDESSAGPADLAEAVKEALDDACREGREAETPGWASRRQELQRAALNYCEGFRAGELRPRTAPEAEAALRDMLRMFALDELTELLAGIADGQAQRESDINRGLRWGLFAQRLRGAMKQVKAGGRGLMLPGKS